ncbi:MAG TPA: long-chain fatty acid--CoA ligase [Chitinophagaceae bacterium]|nr:long-chain fatty acid--CoA ligase [Chitinophagaceae bacterium]
MSIPHRLFDCLADQLQKRHADILLSAKEDGAWRGYSVTEVAQLVEQLAAGLLALGISSGDGSVEGRDKIAVLSKNRPEWIFLDLAVQKIGAVLVPVYPTVHPTDLQFVLNDALVKLVFVNDDDLFQKLQVVRPHAPSVLQVYSFEKVADCAHWREILTLGKQEHFQLIEPAAHKINTEDLLTIIYTSGTTGTPKGVMLSHHNVLSNVLSTLPYLPIQQGARVLSFLPLNHIFERMITYVYLFAGVTIYYAESLDELGNNLREVKPHMFTTVPRLLEKVYEKILGKAEALSPVKKRLFFWALGLAQQYDVQKKGTFIYQTQLALANKLVFSKWREGLGNHLKCIVTGAAACPVKLIRIFTAANITVLEGYGQTETSPVISVNRMEPENRMFGTVGPIIAGVNVKLADDGEILCKGPNVMLGYYKRPDLTEETVKDGWLYTGDIGTLVNGKFLKITDRKKEIFKTSGGKFVAPQPIENKLVEASFIEQIMVVGAGEKFAGALIVPNFKVVREWCTERGIDAPNNASIIASAAVQQQFKILIDEQNKAFNPVEQIKKFELLPAEWSVENGELTPTLKLKRKVIMENYKTAVEKIYNR